MAFSSGAAGAGTSDVPAAAAPCFLFYNHPRSISADDNSPLDAAAAPFVPAAPAPSAVATLSSFSSLFAPATACCVWAIWLNSAHVTT